MRVTVTIDDYLYVKALEFSEKNINNPSDLFQEALRTYVRVQAEHRLVALGGTAPEMKDISRYRDKR